QLEFTHYHHIGIYGYRVGTILDYLQRAPAAIEQAESLEQLRLLHYGMTIAVAITDRPPECGVDTAADLERVNKILAAQK
ncbi:MAG: 3-deoxy-manno-octulosonate cytidylyltransferase, partial [Anaerobiospirillum sp.]|nr:3-deoxy-manno-octulosonate cytidylyltransferase [Anaerobiospirillum sp.]